METQSTYQCVFAGEMYKPAFFHNTAAFPLGVFDRLNYPHKWDVVAGGRAYKHSDMSKPSRKCQLQVMMHSIQIPLLFSYYFYFVLDLKETMITTICFNSNCYPEHNKTTRNFSFSCFPV